MTCVSLLMPSDGLKNSLIRLFVALATWEKITKKNINKMKRNTNVMTLNRMATQLLMIYLVSSAESKLTGTMSTLRSLADWMNELFNLFKEKIQRN